MPRRVGVHEAVHRSALRLLFHMCPDELGQECREAQSFRHRGLLCRHEVVFRKRDAGLLGYDYRYDSSLGGRLAVSTTRSFSLTCSVLQVGPEAPMCSMTFAPNSLTTRQDLAIFRES